MYRPVTGVERSARVLGEALARLVLVQSCPPVWSASCGQEAAVLRTDTADHAVEIARLLASRSGTVQVRRFAVQVVMDDRPGARDLPGGAGLVLVEVEGRPQIDVRVGAVAS